MADINEFKDLIPIADTMNKVLLVSALHGVGKSTVCTNYATDNGMHFEPLILSLMDSGDLLGLPCGKNIGGQESTVWAAPSWYTNIVNNAWPQELRVDDLTFSDETFKTVVKEKTTTKITRAELNDLYTEYYNASLGELNLLRQDNVSYSKSRRSLLLLDEFNRAPQDILNASLQLVLDHRLHSHILPRIRGQETLIIAAINPPNGDYTVQEFDPALLDRFVECSVDPDFASWVKGVGLENLNSAVVEFLRENQGKLHFTPEDNSKGASPRSWTNLSDYITHIEKTKTELSTLYVKGTVGSALAAQFISFYDTQDTSYSFRDIEKLINAELAITDEPCVETLGAQFAELVITLDAVKRNEIAQSFSAAYSEKEMEDALPWIIYLHALPMENLGAVLKTMQADSFDLFVTLVRLDKETSGKALLKKSTRGLKSDG